jgi:hypothetical protein
MSGQLKPKGETYTRSNDLSNPFGCILRAYAERFNGDAAAIADAIEGGDYIGFFPAPGIKARLFESVGDIRSGAIKIFKPNSGELYAVDIPDSGVLLDWDKPVSEQPEKVKAIVASLTTPEITRYIGELKYLLKHLPGNGNDIPTTGELFYNALSAVSGSEKAASLALNEAGVPGIQYRKSPKKLYAGQHHRLTFSASRISRCCLDNSG